MKSKAHVHLKQEHASVFCRAAFEIVLISGDTWQLESRTLVILQVLGFGCSGSVPLMSVRK